MARCLIFLLRIWLSGRLGSRRRPCAIAYAIIGVSTTRDQNSRNCSKFHTHAHTHIYLILTLLFKKNNVTTARGIAFSRLKQSNLQLNRLTRFFLIFHSNDILARDFSSAETRIVPPDRSSPLSFLSSRSIVSFPVIVVTMQETSKNPCVRVIRCYTMLKWLWPIIPASALGRVIVQDSAG